MAKLFTMDGKDRGALKQGKPKKGQQSWKFSLDSYDGEKGQRKEKIENMLEEVKMVREKEAKLKKLITKGKGKSSTGRKKRQKQANRTVMPTAGNPDWMISTEEKVPLEENQSKVKNLIEMVKRMTKKEGYKANSEFDSDSESDYEGKIETFHFDIDDEFDTEILPDEEVQKDLRELDEILPQKEDKKPSFYQMKKKRRKKKFDY